MAFVSKLSKTNNNIGDAYWQDVSQEWQYIEAISKTGLDFKIDEYSLTQKLLGYSKPTYTKPTAYVVPTTASITVSETTMTSV